jgi:hypothetical protein
MIQTAAEGAGLLSLVSMFGLMTWRIVKYAYGIVRERIDELTKDRDYWRNRALSEMTGKGDRGRQDE